MTDPSQDMLCLQHFDEVAAAFYQVDRPNVPWGDFGSILVHGMTRSTARDSSVPELWRTGPFVPPISFPGLGCIVVTEAVRREMEFSGLTGISFVPVYKKVVVPIDWHEWDLLGKEPVVYPDEGEPENYLSEDRHSAELAKEMPNLWRLVISLGATEIREPAQGPITDANRGQIFIRAASWKGSDLFRADTTFRNYASPKARQWFLDRYPEWISFRPVLVK